MARINTIRIQIIPVSISVSSVLSLSSNCSSDRSFEAWCWFNSLTHMSHEPLVMRVYIWCLINQTWWREFLYTLPAHILILFARRSEWMTQFFVKLYRLKYRHSHTHGCNGNSLAAWNKAIHFSYKYDCNWVAIVIRSANFLICTHIELLFT